MPLQKTYEELLASKINPRNYSAVLPIIYNLRKREKKDYFPSAPERIIYSPGVIGDGAAAVFNAISNPSCARGGTITLSGTATYILSAGGVGQTKAATMVVAQIDMGLQNVDKNLIPYQVYATGSEISVNGVGQFSFVIPAEVTQQLSIGTHYVYIDAASPDNAPVRLSASSTPSDPREKFWYTRTFTITG